MLKRTLESSLPASRIIISINSAWHIFNFRAGLIRALIARGCEVIAVAPPDPYINQLIDMGCRFIPLRMDNKGTNPISDAVLFFRYLRILRRERPAAFLGYTIKPNVYGSLAAQTIGIPVINSVTGLGTVFIHNTWLTKVVKRLYKAAFSRSYRVLFENCDDRELFVSTRLVRTERTQLIPGPGIDLVHFVPRQLASPEKTCTFLLMARLIFDKGVREYIEAARIVRSARPGTRFLLVGFLDVENRTAVSRSDVESWISEGLIEYLGHANDVRVHIAAASCTVLPSYREGTPRALLEAAAMAKPIITTDVPGCREVVEDGVTGLLCEVRNANDLAAKMISIIDMGAEKRETMGAAGRAKMERQFDERLVIDAYLDALRFLVTPASHACDPAISY